jgi:hypothetical protein
MRVVFVLAAFVFVLALGCHSTTETFKDDEFRFPAGFSGVAVIVWGDEAGQTLARPRPGARLFEFPVDGHLRLKDQQPQGQRWVDDFPPRFFFVAPDGTTKPIASLWHPAGRIEQIDLVGTFARTHAGRPVCSGEVFVVGFKDDVQKKAMRGTAERHIEAACQAMGTAPPG